MKTTIRTLTAADEEKSPHKLTLYNMETVSYDRFTSAEAEINHSGQKFIMQSGRRNRMMYIIYAILALYVFILTLAVGIKISQISQEVADVRLSMKTLVDAPKTPQFEDGHFSELVMQVPVPVQGPCQENWVFYKGSCYFQSTIKRNWKTAETNCIQKGSHLVVVNDLAEQDFLSSIVKLSDSYWIGLVEKEEGQWSWVDGTEFSATEHHWDVGQPDDWDVRVNGEDCGQLHGRVNENRQRLWNDADCTLFYPYICEGKPKSH
ncbi:asialoglycoprotein receptor-like 1 [Danio aesculapii]|uniref:asialoglycoprotein receptor-like 1 n=1 Tax=Danio aesculapii TaxID=1142201 RepID=UPI0024BF58EF|nr:asialoglycoprotein receptor-like 1 [Danio aesculapii]